MRHKILIASFFLLLAGNGSAQEIQARLSVIASKVSTQIDRKIFNTLQTGLTNFLNARKWTNDVFQPSEKIQCSFLITIEKDLGNNVFEGKMTIQAARPAYNTTYDCPMLNFQDDNIIFNTRSFSPLNSMKTGYREMIHWSGI